MKRLMVLTAEGTGSGIGFGLAGVPHASVEKEGAEDRLLTLAGTPDIGLIILDESLLPWIRKETLMKIETAWPGVLVVLPVPERPAAESEDYALQLIRRAVGYHVRLNL
jgi:vacuolar-type H+-ATPase subunit F/Vma7